jgi:hypothetical protein
LAVILCWLAAILGISLGYLNVWGWHHIYDDYGGLICLGLGVGSVFSLPLMSVGLIVSDRRALLTLILGALAVGIICWVVVWNFCWAILHIT